VTERKIKQARILAQSSYRSGKLMTAAAAARAYLRYHKSIMSSESNQARDRPRLEPRKHRSGVREGEDETAGTRTGIPKKRAHDGRQVGGKVAST